MIHNNMPIDFVTGESLTANELSDGCIEIFGSNGSTILYINSDCILIDTRNRFKFGKVTKILSIDGENLGIELDNDEIIAFKDMKMFGGC